MKDLLEQTAEESGVSQSDIETEMGSSMPLAFDDAFGYYIYIFLYIDFFCHGAFCPGDTT